MPIPPSSYVGKMQQAATVSTARADAASWSLREVQPEVASAAPEHWIQKKTTLHDIGPRYRLMLQECSWENNSPLQPRAEIKSFLHNTATGLQTLPYNPSPQVSILKVSLLNRLAHRAREHTNLQSLSVFLEITTGLNYFFSTIPT